MTEIPVTPDDEEGDDSAEGEEPPEYTEWRKRAVLICNERGHSMGAFSEHGRDASNYLVEVSACKSCDMRVYINQGHPAKYDPTAVHLGVVITGQPLHMDCPPDESSLDT